MGRKKRKIDPDFNDSLVAYFPHTSHPEERMKLRKGRHNRDYIQIMAIDPGLVNMAVRVERRYKRGNRVETLYMEKFSIKRFSKMKIYDKYIIMDNCFSELRDKFDSISDLFGDTDFFVIERQLRVAPRNRIIEGMVKMYLTVTLKDMSHLPTIYTIDALMKYTILDIRGVRGQPKSRKKNGVKFSIDLLRERDDNVGLEIIDSLKKKDDVSDTIIICEAFFMMKNIHRCQ